MDAEAAEEWSVFDIACLAIQQISQTVGASHALPLVEVPQPGHPPSKGLAGRAAANLVCACLSNPATAAIGRLCRRKYINAQKKLS